MVAPRRGFSQIANAPPPPSLEPQSGGVSGITPFTSALRGLTQQFAAGFSKDPATREQYRNITQRNAELDRVAQEREYERQLATSNARIEYLVNGFGSLAETAQAEGKWTDNLDKLAQRQAQLLIQNGMPAADAQQLYEITRAYSEIPKEAEAPFSAVAKLQADLAAGRISQAQFDEAYKREVHIPLPAQTNINIKTSAEERGAANYAARMMAAEPTVEAFTGAATGVGGALNQAAGALPIVGNFLQTPEYQQYRQAQEDWVRAKLRKESGAVIGEEEMAREIKTYFPQPGDSPEVVAQKRVSRAQAVRGVTGEAGNAPLPSAPIGGGDVHYKIENGVLVPVQ